MREVCLLRSVHTGEFSGRTHGTARFHVHTHQGFRKYKFRVTVIGAVTRFGVGVQNLVIRETTALTQDLPIADGSLSQDRWGTWKS